MPLEVPEIGPEGPFPEAQAVSGAPAEEAEQGSGTLRLVTQCTVTFLAAVLIFMFVKVFVAGTYEIPSSSMEDTIQVGDLVVSERISYHLRAPEAGEVVTFKDPLSERTLIKRVIATEGQTVELVNGRVSIDGRVLEEPYAHGNSEPLPIANGHEFEYPYTVPDGHVFVMGDNRANSADSRYFGAVPVSSLSGRAVFIYWPAEHWAGL